MWFRRDLRLRDQPALNAAAAAGDGRVLPVFVLDDRLWQPSGDVRRVMLLRALRALDDALGGSLVVRHGDPTKVLPALARAADAASVHISADYGPYGSRRDEAVAAALADSDVDLVRTGSPYAVAPGRVRTKSGEPFSVFTPFSRAWAAHGWRAPAEPVSGVRWAADPQEGEGALPDEPAVGTVELPPIGEDAAQRRWQEFLEDGVSDYAQQRDRPDLAGTSTLSHHLKYGTIHPRTLLADLARRRSTGAEVFRTELAWREFYADVLFHHPDSSRDWYRAEFARMPLDEPSTALTAWQEGRTGYPFVDAGMRQLLAEGWMHNRLRMVVASFLVKDLHLHWGLGARWFLQHLRDGDLASNQHGWQWAAGSGTDAAPYFRVFNPVTQGKRFDPDGAYVRRYVPELRHLDGAAAHEPWAVAEGYREGYPERVVDHAEERAEALRRYEVMRASRHEAG
jgi:deoxyribodipyrimidine photo-lyase